MRKSILLVIFVFIFCGIGLAQNQHPNKINNERPFLNNDKIDSDFIKKRHEFRENRDFLSNLTDEQKSKIKEIRLSEQKQSLPLRNQINEKRARLRSLETAEKVSSKEINKVIDDITKLQGDLMKLHAESKQKIRALLNDEQRVEFDTKSYKHRSMYHNN